MREKNFKSFNFGKKKKKKKKNMPYTAMYLRAITAAGFFGLLLVYLILALLADKFPLYATGKISKVNTSITGCGFHLDCSELFHKSDELCFKVAKFKSIKFTSLSRIRRESSVWLKHGYLHLQTPDLDFPQDVTICVDFESNSGDTELVQDSSFSSARSFNR